MEESYTNINELLDTNSPKIDVNTTQDEIQKRTCCYKFFCLKLKTCKFHSVIVYMLLLSLLCLFTQMIQGGYMAAVMTNLQTQFNLSTSKIGFILSSFDIMGAIATPFLSYIGSKFNKCRILGVSGIFYVIGSVIYTLPYFIGDRYKILNFDNSNPNVNTSLINIDFCKEPSLLTTVSTDNDTFYDNVTEVFFTEVTSVFETSTTRLQFTTTKHKNECSRDFSRIWPYAVFIIGQLFMSVGSAPLFSLGITYLCDNLDERSHALYTGIVYGAFALGPAAGYLMASVLLSKWLYLDEVPPIKENNPKWVGCWFLGFLLAAGLVFVISILLLSFPDAIHIEAKARKVERKKRKQSKIAAKKLETINEVSDQLYDNLESGSSSNTPSSNLDSISTLSTIPTPPPTPKKRPGCSKKLITRINQSKLKFKGFLSSFLKLILNLRYSLLVIIMSIECILVALFTNYMILYAENVYQVSSSLSSTLVGGVVVPSAILGAIVGGFIVKKFDLYIEGCVRLIILSSCITIGGIFVLLFIRCESQPSVGIDVSKQTFNTSFTECNRECKCYSNYNPVCGTNNITYVSPCYAGCKVINETGYYDCGCVTGFKSSGMIDAKPGGCSSQCETRLIVFLIVAFVVVLAETLSITPATILILKIIDKPLQPFALGLLRCANILLAYIPAPIVLSQVIDKTCVLWNSECIGDKGTCLEYNTFDFHFVLFGSAAGIKIVSGVFLIIFSLYIHKSYILRRKYRSKATLNHDPGSILTPRQKYRIDSEVASLETVSIDSNESTRGLYKKKNINTFNRQESGVTLTKLTILEDSYSLSSQTNDFLSSSSSVQATIRQSNDDNQLLTSNI